MSEKIDLEFSADDRDLTQKINQLKRNIEGLSDAGDMSKGLSDNLSAIRQNINLMKQMTAETKSARLEMERFSKSASSASSSINPNKGNSRQRKKKQSQVDNNNDYAQRAQDRARESISAEQYARSKSNSRTISSFTRGYGSLYEQRNTDNGVTSYQRAMSKYDSSRVRQSFSQYNRDIGTANRGLTDSQKRISNINASNGYVSPNARNTAERNLSQSKSILTDNGRFSNTNDYIKSNTSRISNNQSEYAKYADTKNSITAGAESNGRALTNAEKEIVKTYSHKQQLLLEENKGLENLNKRLSSMDSSYKNLESTMSESKNAPSGGVRGALFNRSKNIANNMIYGTAATLGGLAMSGNSIINQEQPMTRAMGANNGTYNSRAIQVSAQNAGQQYGLTGNDMLTGEMAYMSGAGYTNQKDMNKAGVDTGMFAKLTGTTVAQSAQLTSTYSQNVNDGSTKGLKQLQDTFYGSLKQAGLTNKSYSQSTALSGILSNYGNLRGGDMTNSLANSQVEMQSALGSTGNKALQGANGASFMNQMSSSIIGQGANSKFMQTALMSMNPSKYNGSYQGYANIIDQTQNGLDGTNLKAISGMSNMIGGDRSNSYFSNMLKNNFGVNVTTKTAGDIQKLANSGELDGLGSKASAKKLQEKGLITEKQAKQMQQNSSDATYDKGQANFEKAATSVGNLSRNAIAYGLVLTHGSALLLGFGAAVTAATVSLAKITGSNILSDAIRGGASGGGKGGSGGTGVFTGGSRSKGQGGGMGTRSSSAGGFMSRTASKVSNSKIGRGTSSVLRSVGDSALGQGAVNLFTKGKAKGVGVLAKVGESKLGKVGSGVLSKGSNIVSKVGGSNLMKSGAGLVSKVGGKALGALGLGLGAYDVYNTIKSGGSKKQIGGGIGSTVGSIAGGVLGSALGPIGTVAGSVAGSYLGDALGGGIGSLFDGSGKKKKTATTKRGYSKLSKSSESSIVSMADKYGGEDKQSYIKKMLESNGYKTSSAGKYASKLAGKTKQNVNVTVSGVVRHKGEVEDLSQLNMSKNSVLSQIFSGEQADKTKKR